MGCFSYIKADHETKVANIVNDAPFKLLIPKEFGGGFIKDNYQGYGYLGTRTVAEASKHGINYNLCQCADTDLVEKYDMYELLAIWNYPLFYDKLEGVLNSDGSINYFKEIDEYTRKNRDFGIELFFSDKYYAPNVYSLKLVSCSYKGTYEDCKGVSTSDPNQGCGKLKWDSKIGWSGGTIEEKYQEMLFKVKTTPEYRIEKNKDNEDINYANELSNHADKVIDKLNSLLEPKDRINYIDLDSLDLRYYTATELIKLNKRICDTLCDIYDIDCNISEGE